MPLDICIIDSSVSPSVIFMEEAYAPYIIECQLFMELVLLLLVGGDADKPLEAFGMPKNKKACWEGGGLLIL